jgi:hypothetical protein
LKYNVKLNKKVLNDCLNSNRDGRHGTNEIIKTHIYNYIYRAGEVHHDITTLESELYDKILRCKDLPGIRERLDILMLNKEKNYGDICMNLVLENCNDEWIEKIFSVLSTY